MSVLDRNRLAEEHSPYLQQHADNPVNWQPWDEATIEAARENDRPIFLSIGYAACHWCHVMEKESFGDDEVASVLNKEFVPVKVDREERPDLDSVYISICQMVQGQAGWPLSVFLTPDGRPFFVGTYFPRDPKRNMPGFLQLVRDIAESWNDPEEREELEDRADQWAGALEDEMESVPDPTQTPDADFLPTAADAAVRRADREHGGFGTGQKFPNPGRIHLLARAHDRTDRDAYRDVLTETLDGMANRGLYDHLGGGFHRYCTDQSWTVPHFEKMLYDNAEIPRAFLTGYQLTGKDRYREVVEGTLEFVERELTHDAGGFFSTLDAESKNESGEREEGAFYVWTPERVHAAIEETVLADLFCDRYGVTATGNFEDGQTVLTITESVSTLADEYDLSEDEVEERLAEAERQTFEARERRPRPPRDEKVLAGWNGLMISAFAESALVLDGVYAQPATEALSFIEDRLWDDDERRLYRRWKDGNAGIRGYLEDYAFLARGALDTFEATGDVEHLAFAVELGQAIIEQFYDDTAETLYFTPAGGEDLIARPQEPADQSTPSSMGVAADLLLALDGFVGEDFAGVAERVIKTNASHVESNPLQHASLTLASDTLALGHLELTLVADDLPDAWRDRLAVTYLPTRLLARRPAAEADLEDWCELLGLEEVPPLWADRDQQDGQPTVYACRAFTCSPPKTSLDEALDWAERLAPDATD